VPATVHAKLLVTFVGTVVLMVVLGILGLRVLGESNDRVETLGLLQQRATAYRQLQTTAQQVQSLLSLRNPGNDACVYAGTCPAEVPDGASLARIDEVVASTLTGLLLATNAPGPGFAPPADEQATLTEIGQDRARLAEVMTRISAFDASNQVVKGLQLQGAEALPRAEHLRQLTIGLASTTQGATDRLIESNRSSFGASQGLFLAVAVASIVLALVLGYVLSWSLVGPIRRMERRLDAIASGDFSGHVDVPNRDELGVLAAEINRMNDELGRLYREVEAASRHKSEFLANMSHELRTPLNAIIGFSQVLSEKMFGELNAKQLEYLEDILSSGQHLLNLINDILDLAKVEAGRMELSVATFELAGTLANATVMVRERAVRQGLALETEVDPAVGWLEGDERKVKQVLFNLLSNAVKFTPEGGRILLAARPIGDQVEISVSDTGLGIEPDDQARIFDEFYQVGPGRTQEGTGLGLALTRRLVELHGGQIRVTSVPGEGSTFTVLLPLRQAVGTADEAIVAAGESAPL
jgi:signal transduction histidine kinase